MDRQEPTSRRPPPIDDYGADKIKVLEGLEAVRKRPAMYIGSTGAPGLHHLVYEVVDNSIDEALGGFCDTIDVTIHIDDSVTVVDNGRGIPVDMHESGRSAAEVVLTVLHAGGKFDNDSYKVSGGLHGVGVSVVNALSETLELEIWRERPGLPAALRARQAAGRPRDHRQDRRSAGTKITFKPDARSSRRSSSASTRWRSGCASSRSSTPASRITLDDERDDGRSHQFQYEGGIVEFVKHLNRNKAARHRQADLHARRDATASTPRSRCSGTTATPRPSTRFANNINTHEGGTHLSGSARR